MLLAYGIAAQGMAFGYCYGYSPIIINYYDFWYVGLWSMRNILMIPLVVITLAKTNELFKVSIGIT